MTNFKDFINAENKNKEKLRVLGAFGQEGPASHRKLQQPMLVDSAPWTATPAFQGCQVSGKGQELGLEHMSQVGDY